MTTDTASLGGMVRVADAWMVDGGPCWKCGVRVVLPHELYDAARRSEAIPFYCAYGHRAVYPARPTEVERLNTRLERAEAETARVRTVLAEERRLHSATKGQVTRLKNRAKAGMCPHCRRTFANYQRHMEKQHPEGA